MVHNGIEYGDMQLIAEVYDLLHRGGRACPRAELAAIFDEWNRGELRSYLIEITARILGVDDPETGRPLVDVILDEAQQKGTGKWASQNALDVGAPIPTINAAVEARILSALKSERVAASRVLQRPTPRATPATARSSSTRRARRCTPARSPRTRRGWRCCASRPRSTATTPARRDRAHLARRLHHPRDAARGHPRGVPARRRSSSNLLLDDGVPPRRSTSASRAWRLVVQTAVGLGIPVPALSASLAYFDAYRSERLPANLTQAQRDYFGAHTYRRIDREGTFHTEWPGAR